MVSAGWRQAGTGIAVRLLFQPLPALGCHPGAYFPDPRMSLRSCGLLAACELPPGRPRLAIISGKTAAGPTRFPLPTKILKTTPCKVAGGRGHGCLYLTRRANHRHIFIVARIKPAPENPLRAF